MSETVTPALPGQMAGQGAGSDAGTVTGGVRALLRLEGLTLFASMVGLYAIGGGAWWLFVVLFFVPDVSFAAYLAGREAGAFIYNIAHSYLVPVALMTAGFVTTDSLVLSIAMIWLAHIGLDRALGYGLKYEAGFSFTHLGRIGRNRDDV